jgi:hypothetical protein
MGYSFDGIGKIISLTPGTVDLDTIDLYSRWKDWLRSNPQYLQAFSVVGGDLVDPVASVYVTSYVFLNNGWKIKPQEASHKLRVYNGVLGAIDGSDPFVPTVGDYNVLVQYSQPVRTETALVETGVSGLTPAESAALLDARAYAGNRLRINKVTGVWVLYADDGETPLHTGTIADDGTFTERSAPDA